MSQYQLSRPIPFHFFVSILNFNRPVRYTHICFISKPFLSLSVNLIRYVSVLFQPCNLLTELTLLLKFIKLCTRLSGWSVFIPLTDNRWHSISIVFFVKVKYLLIWRKKKLSNCYLKGRYIPLTKNCWRVFQIHLKRLKSCLMVNLNQDTIT